MIKNQQLLRGFKLQPPLSVCRGMDGVNRGHDENVDTPAWMSLKLQDSRQVIYRKQDESCSSMLDRLNRLDNQIDLQKSNYSKIRRNSLESSRKVNQKDIKKTIDKSDIDSRQRISIIDTSCNKLQSTRVRTDSRIMTNNSLIYSDVSIDNRHEGVIIRKASTHGIRKQSVKKEKRFKEITVHDHLYVDSKRQQTKRLIEKMMDDEYKKKNILTFRPTISQRSQELAAVKFAKMDQRNLMEKELEQSIRELQIKEQKVEKISENVKRQRQQHRYICLRRLFYFLSQEKQIITKQTLKATIQQLPLVMIKLFDKIIQKIYQGNLYSWLQFISAVNSKKMVSNRQALLSVTQNWIDRSQKCVNNYQTQEQTLD